MLRIMETLRNARFSTLMWIGAALRAVLMLYSSFHDTHFRVKYTDIDYMIITDGAAEMWRGGSPFDRATFRYTPLLSLLMIPNVTLWLHAGKAVFAMCDIGAAYYCYTTLGRFATQQSAKLAVAAFILFNPIVVVVSTRGNSDMVVAFLSLAAIASFFEKRYTCSAVWLGFAAHFKLYPVIYAMPLVFGIIEVEATQHIGSSWLAALWRRRTTILQCAGYAALGFVVPTVACYAWYGNQYLGEALLYHFHREDHRHNMSPYWLLMYLNQGRRSLGVGAEMKAGLVAFLPQLAVLLYASYKLRKNVAHACCVQTILFVAFNKVCTVQYFVWFLPFLPFIFYTPRQETSTAVGGNLVAAFLAVLLWGATIPLWVSTAYNVEFLGKNDYVKLWLASCVFFVATVLFAGWIGRVALRTQVKSEKQHKE